MGTCRLLICMYLPKEMVSIPLDDMDADEFIRLAAVARRARHMRQEDLKWGILDAFHVLLSD